MKLNRYQYLKSYNVIVSTIVVFVVLMGCNQNQTSRINFLNKLRNSKNIINSLNNYRKPSSLFKTKTSFNILQKPYNNLNYHRFNRKNHITPYCSKYSYNLFYNPYLYLIPGTVFLKNSIQNDDDLQKNGNDEEEKENLNERIRRIVPENETVLSHNKLLAGFDNQVYWIKTDKNEYVLRFPSILEESRKNDFEKMAQVSKNAYELGIGPEVIKANSNKQEMLITFLQTKKWRGYNNDPISYIKSMKLINKFHAQMTIYNIPTDPKQYLPFSTIFNKYKKLDKSIFPSRIKEAIIKLENIIDHIHPYLKSNAKMVHGDCHLHNILLGNDNKPKLIDFDTTRPGHPFFDVLTSIPTLAPNEGPFSAKLWEAYLGHPITQEEEWQRTLMYTTLLMVIVMDAFEESDEKDSIHLTKKEMDLMLETKELNNDIIKILEERKNKKLSSKSLTPFFNIPFKDKDPKINQTLAISALREFLDMYEKIKYNL